MLPPAALRLSPACAVRSPPVWPGKAATLVPSILAFGQQEQQRLFQRPLLIAGKHLRLLGPVCLTVAAAVKAKFLVRRRRVAARAERRGREASFQAGRRWLLGALLPALGGRTLPAAAVEESSVVARLRKELHGVEAVRSPGQSWAVGQLLPNKRGLQQLYPTWMEGRWSVRSKFLGASAPLGNRFVSGNAAVPGVRKGSIVILADVGGEPPDFEERFVRSELEGGVVADRAANLPARLQAFWPQAEVTRCEYDPEKDPTRLSLDFTTPRRASLQGLGGSELNRQQPTRDKRAIELFINNREGGFETEDAFICSELYRQSALEQARAYDFKTLLALQRREGGEVLAKLRVGAFLNPRDQLYFEAGDQAVAVYDYSLRYLRKPD
ncbi:unnamed protein product [Polarella glacialis]|uniref:DUF6816 domain-containing protein n=2 Tax=Polarella glacialis TaxID=89957 RepID=A0A813D630_POLGL|nr:unnamed protein product [Polarella glacialis]